MPSNGAPKPSILPQTGRPGTIIGYHEAYQLAGQHMVDNLRALESTNPILGRVVVENGFGGMTGPSGAGFREWALSSLSVLTAIGDCSDQVQIYTEAALRHGATEGEILAIINHASGLAGIPRSVNSLRRLKTTLAEAREFQLPKERIVSVGDHETLVREYGSENQGTPIILIHALSMDGRMFQRMAPLLANKYRVLTYDLRGHGFSRGAPLTKSMSHLVQDLKALLDALEIDKADIYGASYGGAVAQYFAIAHPERTRSLSPMATAAKGNAVLLARATRAEAGEMDTLLTEAIIRWFLPENIAQNKWYVRYARANVEHVRVEEWAAAWRAMGSMDCLAQLSELEIPVLVLAGKQDLSATRELMMPIHKACRNSTYVELDPGTHMMAMEQAEAVADALAEFRRKVDGGL